MKTYLLAKKAVPLKDLTSKKYGHNLEKLRAKCSETDSSFEDQSYTKD